MKHLVSTFLLFNRGVYQLTYCADLLVNNFHRLRVQWNVFLTSRIAHAPVDKYWSQVRSKDTKIMFKDFINDFGQVFTSLTKSFF